MAYNAIPASWISVGKALKQSLFQYIADNFEYLFGQIGSVAAAIIPNGSFEIDTDEDGTPDSWSTSTFAGGTVARVTSVNEHGTACIAMTHPGGGGNGGGYALSDYVPCFEGTNLLRFLTWSTVRGIHNKVEVIYYDEDKITIAADETVYDASGGAPLVSSEIRATFTAPNSARFFRVKLSGGVSDVDAAGTAYFDDVRYEPTVPTATAAINNTVDVAMSGSTGVTSWTTIDSQSFDLDLIDGDAQGDIELSFTTKYWRNAGDVETIYIRFRVGSTYSNVLSTTSTSQQTDTATLTLSGLTSTNIALIMEARATSTSGSNGLVDSADTTVQYIA